MTKKILITGGTGFLGSNLVNFFSKKKFEVYFSGRNLMKAKTIERETNGKFYPSSLDNFDNTLSLVKKLRPSIIVHAAASKHVDLCERHPFECVDSNIISTKNIFIAAKIMNCKNFVYISSDKASSPKLNIYSMSKAITERMLFLDNLNSKMNLVTLRFGNLLWSTGSVLCEWDLMLKRKRIISASGTGMYRFFYSVNNACKVIDFLIRNLKKFNNCLIIPSTKSIKIDDLLECFCDINKSKWTKIKRRKIDKEFECLLNVDENLSKKIIKTNQGDLFVIKDPLNLPKKNKVLNEINSLNSEKFNRNEIKKIILEKNFFNV